MPFIDMQRPAQVAIGGPDDQAKFETWIDQRVEANVRINTAATRVYANYADFCRARAWAPATWDNFQASMIAWGFRSATARIENRDVLYYSRIDVKSIDRSFV